MVFHLQTVSSIWSVLRTATRAHLGQDAEEVANELAME